MVDQKTPYLGLSLPHLDNTIDQDCPRMRRTLAALDSHAQTTDAALEAHTAALAAETAARAQADAQQAETLAAETTAREQADADQVETLASLAATVANLWQEMAALNPWTIFPVRVPIAVDGVRFGGSDGRRAILPGETQARENWVLCDGGADGRGGTVPDLRDRMILGASEARPAGSTGGSATHQHSVSGTVGAATLAEAHLASHTHATWAGQGTTTDSGIGVSTGYGTRLRYNNNIGSAGGNAAHAHGLTTSSAATPCPSLHYAGGVMGISWPVSSLSRACPGVSGTLGETTLSVAQLAAHGHTVTLRDTGWGNQALVDAKSANRADSYKGQLGTSSVGSSAPHAHGLTTSSAAASSLPPWHTLTYIMRIS